MRILLVVYDNDSYIHWFPQGLAYVAAVLRKQGHEVVVYNQDMHHYPEEHLAKTVADGGWDAVGVSFVAGYFQYQQMKSISRAINACRPRPVFIMGGHGPAPEPEFFLKRFDADVVVLGEGEETAVELFAALDGKRPLDGIAGLAFRDGDRVVTTKRREPIADIDTLPWPAYDLFPIHYYRLLRMPHCSNSDFVMPVLSGRGCTFTCNFCYRLDPGFRARRADALIEEIRFLKKDYGVTYVAFSDELLMSSEKRTRELCEAFIAADLRIKWDCNGRLNYATPEILALMKRAGCVFINYGIEAFDDQILRNMKKALTCSMIVRGIENTLAAGISPGYNIIFGNIGESEETLRKGVEFLLKYDDGAQRRTIRPVTPYPGSPLYYHAIETGKLRDCEDFYERKHLNSDLLSINFTDLSDDQFHEALLQANSQLLRRYYQRAEQSAIKQAEDLYRKRDTSFRGFRQS